MSEPETAALENPPDQPENPAEIPENPADIPENPAEIPENPADTPEKPPESTETPTTDNENKPPDPTTDKPTSTPEKPVKPKKPKETPQAPDSPSSETLFDILKHKWNSIYHNPYRMRIIMCTIIFFLALEVARELRNIAFPLRLYKPFKKIGECIKCITKILSG